ncbi:MAG: radical SAM protein [Pseudomonadota bacterium]
MQVLFVADIKNFALGGFEPLGLEYLSACLKKAGHTPHICDLDLTDAVATVKEHGIKLVAYSVVTGAHQRFADFNRRLKRIAPLTSIFGGPHPTFVPSVLEQEPGLDLICVGEGERALVELCDRMDRGQGLEGIPNLRRKEGGQIVAGPVEPGQRSLDDLPFPDRALLYGKFPHLARTPMKTVLAGRGCTFKCSYCFHRDFMSKHGLKNKVRMRRVDLLVQELAGLRDHYPVQFFRFVDASLGFSKKWLREFSPAYAQGVRVPFSCALNPLQADDEVMSLLKQAGCHSVNWSVETGDEGLRRSVLNRPVPDGKIYEMGRLLKKHGLVSWVQNMVGLPGGSLAADFKTLDMNIALRPAFSTVSFLTPYPGTPIHDTARDMGLFDGDLSGLDQAYFHGSVLKVERREELANLGKLFALCVEFPWMRPYLPGLIRLPLGPVYEVLRKGWKGWCMVNRVMPNRPTAGDFARTAWRLLSGTAG